MTLYEICQKFSNNLLLEYGSAIGTVNIEVKPDNFISILAREDLQGRCRFGGPDFLQEPSGEITRFSYFMQGNEFIFHKGKK